MLRRTSPDAHSRQRSIGVTPGLATDRGYCCSLGTPAGVSSDITRRISGGNEGQLTSRCTRTAEPRRGSVPSALRAPAAGELSR